jgi:release factor glutamine methyltransferase
VKPLVEVLAVTTEHFRAQGIPSPRLDAELLLAHALGLSRIKLYLEFDRPLSEEELATLRPLVRRRAAREPLAWVLGSKGFHAHDFAVGPGTLVPRPDTETLVELALAWIPEDEDPVYVADVGSGTGCIGLSVAAARPGVRLFALDLSDVALATTRKNVEALGLGARVAVLRSDLLAGVPTGRPIDWVLSNPPYIPSGDIDGLAPEVSRHEPRLALDGGVDGLEVYRRLIPQAASRARKGVILEIGQGQQAAVGAMLEAAGLEVETREDLAGIVRVVAGRKT